MARATGGKIQSSLKRKKKRKKKWNQFCSLGKEDDDERDPLVPIWNGLAKTTIVEYLFSPLSSKV